MLEHQKEERLVALITIVDYSYINTVKDIYLDSVLPLHLMTHGYGSAKSEIYDILGFGSPKKTVALSIMTYNMSKGILKELYSKLHFDKPGTGIAFIIDVNSVSGSLYKLCTQAEHFEEEESEGITMDNKDAYSLIITIVNNGYFDKVMDAANDAGASGGTLLHARGLGSKEAEKFLGITIQPEKDIVLIIASQDKKQAIMSNITHEVGLNTDGMGICFSLPVDDAVGLFDNIN